MSNEAVEEVLSWNEHALRAWADSFAGHNADEGSKHASRVLADALPALRAMREQNAALRELCERARPMANELGCAMGCNETSPPMTCTTCKWLADYAALRTPETENGSDDRGPYIGEHE